MRESGKDGDGSEKPGAGGLVKSKDKGNVNGEEPKVTGKSVEDSTERGLDAGESS